MLLVIYDDAYIDDITVDDGRWSLTRFTWTGLDSGPGPIDV